MIEVSAQSNHRDDSKKHDESLFILADLIIDSYLENTKSNNNQIEQNKEKDYDEDALSNTEGLF